VHLPNVAAVDVRDLGVLAQSLRDLLKHPQLIRLLVLGRFLKMVDLGGLGSLGGQMLGDIPVDQVLHRRRVAPLALFNRGIFAAVDALAQLLGYFARGTVRDPMVIRRSTPFTR
jgi:hypothetical protein